MKRLIALALLAGFAATVAEAQPPPTPPPDGLLKPGTYEWHPERSTFGPVVVLVSLPDQQAYVFRNGVRIGRTSISSGRPGHATPTGVFVILQKDKDHHSSIYNNAPMPYMERLTWGGIALHAGNLPGYPASHGCVRLPLEFSRLLFGVTSMSTTVVVADHKTADDATLRPGLLLASAYPKGSDSAAAPLPDPGQGEWTPEKAPEGPMTLLFSGDDRTLYVNRNGILIGRAPISIADAATPLTAGVFVMLEGHSTEPNPFVPGSPMPRWQVVSLQQGAPAAAAHDVIDRVRLPAAFARQVYDALVPGTTVMVTGRSATGFTTTPADFTVMATDVGK